MRLYHFLSIKLLLVFKKLVLFYLALLIKKLSTIYRTPMIKIQESEDGYINQEVSDPVQKALFFPSQSSSKLSFFIKSQCQAKSGSCCACHCGLQIKCKPVLIILLDFWNLLISQEQSPNDTSPLFCDLMYCHLPFLLLE